MTLLLLFNGGWATLQTSGGLIPDGGFGSYEGRGYDIKLYEIEANIISEIRKAKEITYPIKFDIFRNIENKNKILFNINVGSEILSNISSEIRIFLSNMSLIDVVISSSEKEFSADILRILRIENVLFETFFHAQIKRSEIPVYIINGKIIKNKEINTNINMDIVGSDILDILNVLEFSDILDILNVLEFSEL